MQLPQLSLLFKLFLCLFAVACATELPVQDSASTTQRSVEFTDFEENAAPLTFEEEFPYLRIKSLDDGSYSALVTIPKESGQSVESALMGFCVCLQGENPTATIETRPGGGVVYTGSNVSKAIDAKLSPVEDLLVVKGSEEDLRSIFNALDFWFNSGPQIEIQAEVFETSKGDETERGITVGDNPLFVDNQSKTFLKTIGVNLGTSSNPTLDGGGSGAVFETSVFDSSFNMNGIVQLLNKEGFVDILSQPRIVTRSGVGASVSTKEEIPFLNPTGVSFSGLNTYAVGTKNAGVELTVTPMLVGSDTIHMVIKVNVSRLGRDYVIGSDASNNQIIIPSLNTRDAHTTIYVRNGQYVVIGGLKLKSERVNESKIPFLGNIPILGWFFSSRETVDEETSVSFVIRPVLKRRPSIEPFGDYFDPFAEEELVE
jgi:type II secretory pathway component GspD/PulD (secretin)